MELEKILRQRFFAFRNGVVADALRRGGDPHEVIMGCQLADIISITAGCKRDAALAQALWSDRRHRECRLAATMLMPPEEFSRERALEWCNDVESAEVADVLCHRLLRHLDFGPQLWRELSGSDNRLVSYLAYRLLMNLLATGKDALSNEERARINGLLETAEPPLRQLLKEIVTD